MAEGGIFHWKIQNIKEFAPAADYSRLRDPLPDPPKGTVWHQDEETREWKLVKETEPEVVINGGPAADADSSPADIDSSHLAATAASGEEEWDLVSGCKISHDSPSADDGLLVASETQNLSTMKVNRRNSSSTIDSSEGGVLGVDYVEHVVLPTDTLQGICLAYNISAMRLRQANQFSGSTLLLAPKRLVIPVNKQAIQNGRIRIQDKNSKQFKTQAFLAERPDLCLAEAKAYLDIADWELDEALRDAREDAEWEQKAQNQIHQAVPVSLDTTTTTNDVPATAEKSAVQVEIYEGVPADAPVSSETEDEHGDVEMQPLLDVDSLSPHPVAPTENSAPHSVTPKRNVASRNSDDSWVEMQMSGI